MPVGAIFSSLKTAAELGKSLLDLRDQALVQKKVIELNAIILSAQDTAVSAQKEELKLIEEVSQLKKRIAELEGKSDDMSRYQRTDMGGGKFAYTLKDDAKAGEIEHYLCSSCFEQGRSSTLQMQGVSARGQKVASCPACKTKFRFGTPREPEVRRGSWIRGDRSRFGG